MNVDHFIEWAHQGLVDSSEAQEYFLGRGVSKDQWKLHNLGFVGGTYVPDPKDDALHNEKCGDKDHRGKWCDTCRYVNWSTIWAKDEETGKFKALRGEKTIGSVVLPLTSYSGKTIGFQVRSLEGKVYDTFTLKKRPEGYFFGIRSAVHSAWARRAIFVTEGPFDDLIFERLVTPNVVALTTSSPGKGQINFFHRFVDVIFSCLDRDKAGHDGFLAMMKYMPSKTIVEIDYPKISKGDKDLGDFWRRVGDEKFSSYFKEKLRQHI